MDVDDNPAVDVDRTPPNNKQEAHPGGTESQERDGGVGREKVEASSKKREAVQNEESEEEIRTAKRVKLGTLSGGWLEAAPSDQKKRKAFARSKEEILEAYGGEKQELYTKAAATEWAQIPKVDQPTVAQTQSRRRNESGPNFKAFRKNPVPRTSVVKYQFTAVKSLASTQLARFAEESASADEHLRKANELFQDVGRKTASGRRRKLQ